MLVVEGAGISADQAEFEIVERKGIGHPDSLADILAEEFSRRYSLYALDRLGVVPNHWVDKVALIGAASAVDFGGFKVDKPISSYLFGKVTATVGQVEIPVEDLFQAATAEVLVTATRCPDILSHVRHSVENTSGTAADHPRRFYFPTDADDCREQAAQRRANDTAFCVAHAPATWVERLAIDLENHINGPEFAASFPAAGSDVKVMLLRAVAALDVTVCLPFHPELARSRQSYQAMLGRARDYITTFLAERVDDIPAAGPIRVAVNTKDDAGGAYLAPFGTSLGKGDCGLVGRGNKISGVIASGRSSGVEAYAGKNPVHHAGKLYTLAAAWIADRIYSEFGLRNETVLMSRNGDPLGQPAFIGVRLSGRATAARRAQISDIATDTLSRLDLLTKRMVETPAIEQFRDPRVRLDG